MPKIDKMLQMMTERNVNQVLMMSDHPFQILLTGSKASGPITPHTQLMEIMGEIVPPSFVPELQNGGKFQFRYASDYGHFDFGVEKNGEDLQVSIKPAKKVVAPPLQAPLTPRPAPPLTPLIPSASTPSEVQPPTTDSLATPNRELYISQNGQSIGPMSPEAAQQGVQSGQYMLHDMAIAPHMKSWDTLQNVLDYYGTKPVASVSTGAMTPAVGNRASTIRAFLNEEQDATAVANVVDRLQEICTPDETILYIAVQKKPVINIACASVALTTKRVIMFKPKAMGFGLEFQDFMWWNVANTHISEQLLGSTFFVQTTNGAGGSIDSLPKAQARKLYQFSQQKEEHMHRYRRELALEERRAGASNISMVNNMPAAQSTPVQPVTPQTPLIQEAPEDPIATLKKLKTMFEMDLISQEEFDSKKAEIMARL